MNRIIEWRYFIIGLMLVVLCIAVAEFIRTSSIPASPTPPAAMTSSELSLVMAYESAFNRHDLDGTMALLSENVSFFLTDWNSQFLSRQETQNAHAYFIAINGEIQLTDCELSANTVLCKLIWADDCSRAAGMNGVDEEVIFTLNGDKIRKIAWQFKQIDAHQEYLEFNI